MEITPILFVGFAIGVIVAIVFMRKLFVLKAEWPNGLSYHDGQWWLENVVVNTKCSETGSITLPNGKKYTTAEFVELASKIEKLEQKQS